MHESPGSGAFEISFTPDVRFLLIAGVFVNSRRIIFTVYAAVVAALAVAGGAVILDARAQYRQLKLVEAKNRQKLADAQARLHEQERILERLKSDPEYVERAIRQRLKYARPGDQIYRFPE